MVAQNSTPKICSVEGCGEKHLARGWCRRHYREYWDRKAHGKQCSVDGCERFVFARGWCSFHYKKNKPGDPCSVESCDRIAVSRGWCDMHYQRLRVRPITKPCKVVGCPNPSLALGLCCKHYQRYRTCGDTGAVRKGGRRGKYIVAGQRFGRLVTLAQSYPFGNNFVSDCRCDCGASVTVQCGSLRSGGTKSCGCAKSESIRAAKLRHGESCRGGTTQQTKEYTAWTSMRRRCGASRGSDYAKYAALGITVCERWNSFENFLADMGRAPSPKYSIDRKDNDKGYSPDNCRWLDKKGQARNRRTNFFISHEGNRRTLSEWEEITGLKAATIRGRIDMGWTVVRALTEPLGPNHGRGQAKR